MGWGYFDGLTSNYARFRYWENLLNGFQKTSAQVFKM